MGLERLKAVMTPNKKPQFISPKKAASVLAQPEKAAQNSENMTFAMQNAKIDELKALLYDVHKNDRKFAEGLIAQFQAKGWLSPKQWPFIHTFIKQATLKGGVPDFTADD